MRQLLAPLTPLYGIGVALDRALARPQRLSVPVISVGNITWGGTGKTPAVIALARYFSDHGRRTAILTRGYRRAGAGPVIVSDGAGVRATPEQGGDEPYLIARESPATIVMAGADRYAAGLRAHDQFHPALFILDDGFQHWRLQRDLDIVCVNAADPFGNGHLIPAGSLRERPDALRRADLILLTSADRLDESQRQELVARIADHTPAPVCQARTRITGLRRVVDGVRLSTGQLAGRPVTVVSALGSNAGFVQSVTALGCRIVGTNMFRDHHRYTPADLRGLSNAGEGIYITSAKDAVKLKSVLGHLPGGFAVRWFETDSVMEFMAGEEIWQQKLKPFL